MKRFVTALILLIAIVGALLLPIVALASEGADHADEMTVGDVMEIESSTPITGSGGGLQRAAARLALRRTAFLLTAKGQFANARKCREVLNDQEKLDSFCDIAFADATFGDVGITADTPWVEAIMKLVNFLIEKAPEILKIVTTIISLFADQAYIDQLQPDVELAWEFFDSFTCTDDVPLALAA